MKGFSTIVRRIQDVSRYTAFSLKLTWQASAPLLLCLLLLMTLQAIIPPLQLTLSKLVIDRAAFDLGARSATATPALHFPLLIWIALAAGTLAIGQLLQPVRATLESLAGDRLSGYITGQILRATNRWQGLARFEDPEFISHLHRARNNAARGGLDLLLYGGGLVAQLFTIISLIAVLFFLHPLVPLILVLATIPQAARAWEYGHRTVSHLYWQAPDARALEYYRDTVLTAESAKDVRLYHLGPFFDTGTGRANRRPRRSDRIRCLSTFLRLDSWAHDLAD
jgi:ATP-binding cassette subfamily B protein